ncbi:MAG: twitching motility protein PilT [Calditrichaeota bacterium]|nr:MAG: twitching motility protein PilT [Calditrichota bacterium]
MKKREYKADFRFYEELNDFLPPEKRKQTCVFEFNGHPGIKDPIEAQRVPHTEVDLIVVNGKSVGFEYQLQHGDRVAVYPVFESLDISPIVRLREKPLRRPAFVLDVHLGKLARMLRLLGFDIKYENDFDDPEIVQISLTENRIILTRDRRVFYAKEVTHGYWVRSTDALQQVEEVLNRFDLHASVQPFHRCTACNGRIQPVPKQSILHRLQPKTIRYFNDFFQCVSCDRIYWKGSHFQKLQKKLQREFKIETSTH